MLWHSQRPPLPFAARRPLPHPESREVATPARSREPQPERPTAPTACPVGGGRRAAPTGQTEIVKPVLLPPIRNSGCPIPPAGTASKRQLPSDISRTQ